MNHELDTTDVIPTSAEDAAPPQKVAAGGRVFPDKAKRRYILAWVAVLARFFTVQLLVQVALAVAGILIIRLLTKSEYAWYAMGTSLMFAAKALSDCGVGVALTAIGGKVWEDGDALGSLIASALSVRKWFVGLVIIGVGIVVPLLLRKNGAALFPSLSLTGAIVLSIIAQFSISLYGVVPKLRANYSFLQNSAMLAIAVRLLLIGLLYLCFASATTVMLANVACLGILLWLYRRFAAKEVNLRAGVRKEMVSEILSIVRKQVPYELYGAISGQLGVLLISIFGNTGRVADVGALGRLAVVFTALSGVLTNVLLPRFARCQDPKRLRPLFWKILLLYSGVLGCVLLICGLFPNQVVAVLGRNYSNLGNECLLAVAGSVAGAILSAVWGLNISRGWIIPAWIGVTLGVAVQACGVILFDVRTVHGILLMTLFVNLAGVTLHLTASGYFFHQHQKGLISKSAAA